MYATKQQLLNLIGIMRNSSTKDDDCDAHDHRHDLFDNVDQNRLEDMRIELEEELEEIHTLTKPPLPL
jgi:hypothetical protein